MRIEKGISAVLACLMFFWIGRIVSINRIAPSTLYYDIGDSMDCGEVELLFLESHIDNPNEFTDRFGVNYVNDEAEYRMISICIEVFNKSDKDIAWNEIFSFLEGGFESPTWASTIDPSATSMINILNNNSLASGNSQRIWLLTEINKSCFKDSTWQRIEKTQYIYVLSLVPQKTAVRLDA